VTLVGEAGVGKSRLTAELKALAGNPDEGQAAPLWLEGRCLELGMQASYWPFLDLLQDHLGGATEDDGRTRGERIVTALRELVDAGGLTEDRLEEIGPILGNLLSVKFGDAWDDRLKFADGQQIRHQTFMAVRDFLVALSRQRPVVVVLDDLHWGDSLSVDLISFLMEALPLAPILLLCIYRPEQEHPCWRISTIASRKLPDRLTEIRLRELTRQQSARLMDSLVRIENLPDPVTRAILDRAQGNPFFVEEVVRSLIDRDLVFQEDGIWRAREGIEDVAVPDSVHSVVLSRVDRLSDDLRRVLQGASVIGRMFRLRVLRAISEHESGVSDALWDLQDRDLVYQAHVTPEEEYSFRHVLAQEAVYQTILERRRADFHGQVGRALEALYQDDLEEYVEQLAHHYELGGDPAKAVEYLLRSASKATSLHARDEALAFLARAVDLAPTPSTRRRALMQRGLLYTSLFRGADALDDFHAVLDSEGRVDSPMALDARLGIAQAYYQLSLDDKADVFAVRYRAACDEAYEVAKASGDTRRMAQALIQMRWLLLFWPEEGERFQAHTREALHLSQEVGDPELINDSQMTLVTMAQHYASPTNAMTDAVDIAEALLGDLRARHDTARENECLFGLMFLYRGVGDFGAALSACEQGFEAARLLHVPAVQYATLKAMSLIDMGRFDEAWQTLQEEIADDDHLFGRLFRQLGEGTYY